MRTLELGKHRRARIWTGDLPNASYPSTHVLTYSIAASDISQPGPTLAAVEVFVPLGGRFIYGLLGGHWVPDPSLGRLDVDICVAAATGRVFGDSLAIGSDEVRVGLPAEYAQGVMAGVDLAASDLNTVSAGRLSINCAAHGHIGSSNVVFKHLAAILIKLVNGSGGAMSIQELIELFPGVFA
jgi:hypothetical protein